eukprot:SAG31_NODE_638_length_13329_cov_13.538095_1_plen_71_part_10
MFQEQLAVSEVVDPTLHSNVYAKQLRSLPASPDTQWEALVNLETTMRTSPNPRAWLDGFVVANGVTFLFRL